MHLIPLNCILKNGQDGNFMCILSQFKKNLRKSLPKEKKGVNSPGTYFGV